MVNHICPTCLKNFKRKVDLTYHIEMKKKPCKPLCIFSSQLLTSPSQKPHKSENLPVIRDIDMIVNIENTLKLSCIHCGLVFNRKDNLKRHINNYCKVNKENKDAKDKENILLRKEIEELKKMFYEFSKHNKNTNNLTNIQTQNNNTQNNNTQNNINIILPHGKELEKIELNEVLDQMTTLDFKNMLPNMIKYIYLNADKPENQNFIVNDIARNKCKYFDGEKWLIGKATEKLLGIFENTNSLFVDPFDEPEAIKTVEFIRKNKKYKDKYPTILKCKNYAKSLFNEFDKESIESRQQIIDELKIIFYNHREEILKITI